MRRDEIVLASMLEKHGRKRLNEPQMKEGKWEGWKSKVIRERANRRRVEVEE